MTQVIFIIILRGFYQSMHIRHSSDGMDTLVSTAVFKVHNAARKKCICMVLIHNCFRSPLETN